ncbi:MAG: 3-isopropylmalate dehydratase small subunit [bacterium]|nr:3-isopropylmalate dehydratase small subunit [bacterium]
MSVRKIVQVKGRAVPLPGDDIDTDRIVPARFLKAITFEGMEKTLFCDERERHPDHPLDEPAYKGAKLLIVGRNFGSGSSREHAPQAIMRAGFELILGVSFAEIFAGNCFAIGVPLATLSPEDAEALMRRTQEKPGTVYTVDLEALTVAFEGGSFPIEMDEARRSAFLRGTWSVLENLRANLPKVREVSAKLPYISGFGG